MPLLGQPMLLRQIERIKRCRAVDRLMVATSDQPSDDEIAALCAGSSIECFRGELNDVLDRYYQASKHSSPDHVVRLTGDCPLADPDVIGSIIDCHLNGGFDYTSNVFPRTFPRGLDAEVMRFAALEEAWREARQDYEREHVTPFIHQQPQRFRIGNYESAIDYSALRWTVDEPLDFELVELLYKALHPENPAFKTRDILTYLEQRPELRAYNIPPAANA